MSKISSYKKLYYLGFTFLFIILGLLVYSLLFISKQYNWIHVKSKDTLNSEYPNLPDTIYQEKIVEKLRIDTLKVYIPVKPKVERTDSVTTPSLSTSNQSQN